MARRAPGCGRMIGAELIEQFQRDGAVRIPQLFGAARWPS